MGRSVQHFHKVQLVFKTSVCFTHWSQLHVICFYVYTKKANSPVCFNLHFPSKKHFLWILSEQDSCLDLAQGFCSAAQGFFQSFVFVFFFFFSISNVILGDLHAIFAFDCLCILTCSYNRLQSVKTVRWQYGSILSADVRACLNEHEVRWELFEGQLWKLSTTLAKEIVAAKIRVRCSIMCYCVISTSDLTLTRPTVSACCDFMPHHCPTEVDIAWYQMIETCTCTSAVTIFLARIVVPL